MRLTTTLFQRARTRALPKAGLLAGLVLLAATSWSHAGSNAGDDIPTAGRSLFDILTTVQTKDGSRLVVPFPYENLRALIAKTGDMKEANLTETHIPLGRSLQREAAAPNFFASPRLLLGVTGETPTSDPATTLVLKDRLYVGYQPRAGTLEVISFNEQAGRFEFQIVEDYAPGMTPRTVQARRPLCLSCHHGGGPIFSDPPWSETPANPRIAARLNKAAGRSPDDPQIIRRNQRAAEVLHRSVRGANRLAHLGNLWTGMCSEPDAGRNCKTGLLSTVLEHRLSGRRSYGQGDLQTRRGSEITLEKAQRLGWPNGIAIASPFIADRDPLSSPAAKPAAKPSPTSSTTTDPLASRPPIRRLDMAKPGSSDQIIDMLGDLFTAGDIRWLDSALLELAENVGAPRRVATVPCALQRAPTGTAPPVLVFLCNNRVPGFPRMTGRLITVSPQNARIEIDALSIERLNYEGLTAIAKTASLNPAGVGEASFRPADPVSGLGPRTREGWTIASVALGWNTAAGVDGEATFTMVDDITRLRITMGSLAGYVIPGSDRSVTEGGLRRRDIMRALALRLGHPAADWCCGPDPALPPATTGAIPGLSNLPGPAHPSLQAFHRNCGACHAGPASMPPNFLFGPSERQLDAIAGCAPQILTRLAEWQAQTVHVPPMPPPAQLALIGKTPQAWLASADFRKIQRFTEKLAGYETSPLPSDRTALPACAPVNEAGGRSAPAVIAK